MSVTRDMTESWLHPRRVMRRHLDRGPTEPLAFTLLLVFVFLAFVAQWPGVARLAALDPGQPMAPHLLGRAMALLATVPLFYGLALLVHWALRSRGGQGSPLGTRMALFLALLASAPAVLFQGLVAGLVGPGPSLTLTGILVFAGFAWLAVQMQREVHWP